VQVRTSYPAGRPYLAKDGPGLLPGLLNDPATRASYEQTVASLQKVAALIDAGTIKPFVGKVYRLSEVAEAWRDAPAIEGKTVFAVSG